MRTIILDTNIVSTFLKIDELSLLQSLFPNHVLAITTGVREELQAAEFNTGPFAMVKLTRDENDRKEILARTYGFLGKGELECIAFGLSRSIPMLTNDHRAKNAALEQGITCFDLPEILRAMIFKGTIDLVRLQQIVHAIESKDNIIFKNVERLYE